MSQKRDCYEVLGLDRGATEDKKKKNYHNLNMKYYADRN